VNISVLCGHFRMQDNAITVNDLKVFSCHQRHRRIAFKYRWFLIIGSGVGGAPGGGRLRPVSAVRGDNLGKVREILCDRVAHESNAARTASAELDAITARLRPTAAHREVVLDPAGARSAAARRVQNDYIPDEVQLYSGAFVG